MSKEDIVSLKNDNGQTLFGILHAPEDDRSGEPKIGINLINAGLKNRVAPNRLYVKIARYLALKGYYVFRMDQAGIGDSEGEIPEEDVVNIWGEIQQGRFVADTVKMNEFFMNACSLDKLILAGSCGGAITALLAAERDKRARGIVLIDVPVTFASTKTISEDYLNIIEADEVYRRSLTEYYLKSIFNPRKWLRILTMQSDYKAIIKTIALKIRDLSGAGKRNGINDDDVCSSGISNLNPYFFRAFESVMIRGIPVLFICAEKDTDTQLFYKGFRDVQINKGDPHKNRYEIYEVEEANHIYTLTKSQDQLKEKISSWIDVIS